MEAFRRIAPAIILVLGSIFGVSAKDEPPRQIGVLVEYIAIDEPTATALQRKYRGQRDLTALRDELQTIIDKGGARVAGSSYLRTLSNHRGKVESTDGIVYPTEFDPPEVPQTLVGPIGEGVKVTTHSRPSAFVSRPAGITLEVDPVVSQTADVIEINIAPKMVAYLGEKRMGKDEAEVSRPVFYTLKATTAITVVPGEFFLIGVHTPHISEGDVGRPDRGRRVFLFVRAILIGDAQPKAGGDK